MPAQRPRFFRLGLSIALALSGTSTLLATTVEARPIAKKRPPAVTKPRVAVLYFDDTNGEKSALPFLRKGLTQMLISDLTDGEALTIIERTDLEMVLKELKLGRTRHIDRSTANRIGKLLAAQYLIMGSYFEYKGTLHITGKVINVELGTIEGVSLHKSSAKFADLESDLSSKLRSSIRESMATKAEYRKERKRAARRRKVKGAPSIKTAALSPVSAKTVANFGKALDSIDRGDKTLAMKELKSITQSDPDFLPAANELKVLLR